MRKDYYVLDLFTNSIGLVFLALFITLVFKTILPGEIEIMNHSFVSSYQSINCEGNDCYIQFYNDKNDSLKDSCLVKTDARTADSYKSKKTRVFYNDYKCALNPIYLAKSYVVVELFVIAAVVIVLLFQLFRVYKALKKCMIIKHFETHEPMFFKDVYCYSYKNVAVNGYYNHKVKVNIEIPGHGKVTVKDKVSTYKNRINKVHVIIDPNNIKKALITDSSSAEHEYDEFIEKYYNKSM